MFDPMTILVIGRLITHHKTKKLKFVLVPIFMVLQIALFVWAFLYLD